MMDQVTEQHGCEHECPNCGQVVRFEASEEPVLLTVLIWSCNGEMKPARIGATIMRCPICRHGHPNREFEADYKAAQAASLNREFIAAITDTTATAIRRTHKHFERVRRWEVLLGILLGGMAGVALSQSAAYVSVLPLLPLPALGWGAWRLLRPVRLPTLDGQEGVASSQVLSQ